MWHVWETEEVPAGFGGKNLRDRNYSEDPSVDERKT
jgi:hypothetical protein